MVKDDAATTTTTTTSQPMRGRGEVSRHKNAKKKQLMAEKATREAKQLADAKLQPFSMFVLACSGVSASHTAPP